MYLINIGGNCLVADTQILFVAAEGSAPIKRMLRQAKVENMVVDASAGKQIRSVVVTISGTVFRSNVTVETLQRRVMETNKKNTD